MPSAYAKKSFEVAKTRSPRATPEHVAAVVATRPGASGGRARPPWARRWSPTCRARRPSRRARRAPGPAARTAGPAQSSASRSARRPAPRAPRRGRASGSATSTLGRQSARMASQVPGGEPRIERHRDGADLDRGEERRREADAVRQEQGDPLLGLDAAGAQRVARAVDEGAQLGIGDAPGRRDQRRLIAQALGDRLIDEGGGGVVHRQAEPAGARPRRIRDAVEDPVELVPAVGMSGPERVEALEPGEIAESRIPPDRPWASHPDGSGDSPRPDRSRTPRTPPRHRAARPVRAAAGRGRSAR